MRMFKENEVRKLHNRISLLQMEEEKAIKRIEETRQKAQLMLESKMEQERNAKELNEKKNREMMKLQRLCKDVREEEDNVKIKVMASHIKKKENALEMKFESTVRAKQMKKSSNAYLRKAQERRFELQVMQEASRIK